MMDFLTMRNFGRMGRWSNQCFQYVFLKLYAEKYDCQLQLPPWAGNEILGANDPPITATLMEAKEHWQGSHLDEHVPPVGDEFVNTDWSGYGQYHTSYYEPHREKIRQLLRPLPRIEYPLQKAFGNIQRNGNSVIGLHLRRGDYGRFIFHLTPTEWYQRWLRENWHRFVDPILFIATEDRNDVDAFDEWNPYTTDDLGIELAPIRDGYNYLNYDLQIREPWQMDFYPDFYCLSQCDVLVTANSTFSFMAAMLNDHLLEMWRSSLPLGYFERIDPWNARPMRLERCEDYPDLEGVRLESNPYW